MVKPCDQPMELQSINSHTKDKEATYNILLGDKGGLNDEDYDDDHDEEEHHHAAVGTKKQMVESFDFTILETPTWRKVHILMIL